MPGRSDGLGRGDWPLKAFVAAVTVAGGLLAFSGRGIAAAPPVKGSAFGYFAKVSLFGGPANLRGFGQMVCTAPNVPAGCVPTVDGAGSVSPSVVLPGTGGNVSQTAPKGAKAQYGPATIFGGEQLPDNGTPPPSGPITVSSQGTTVPLSVTTAVDIVLYNPPTPATPGGVGPNTFYADEVHSKCNATASGVTASTTIVKGTLATSTNSSGDAATTVNIPATPPPNYTVNGDINNVGDHFKDVFNEQIKNADGSITVNAFHEYLLGPTAVGDLVVAQSVCGVDAAAASVSTTTGPTVTTTALPTTVGSTIANLPRTKQPSAGNSASSGSNLLLPVLGVLAVVVVAAAAVVLSRRRRGPTP